ncbi:MAG: MurR/RpiR family transcriptional regulator [Negativicutes bacterium]|nr:MurR/RpiR family transcriptional regulator [Negativicutes bacterium]
MEANKEKMTGCLPRLRSMGDSLTKAEQKIVDYILANPANIVHMSITELAEESGGAEATVFRLCQKAGFKGYQHFKIMLAQELYSPLESVCSEVSPEDPLDVLVQKVFGSIQEGLQDTLKIVDYQAMTRAIAAVIAARRIDVYGSGGSAVVAADIEHRFMRLDKAVRAYSDPHMQITAASLLKPGDVVIAVSHTGANRDVLESVNAAKVSGATVIVITSHMRSPLSRVADILLCGMARETLYRSEALASRLIHLALVDALYVGVILGCQQEITVNMPKIRQAIASRRI